MRCSEAGFTLLEVVVALSLGAAVILLAHRMSVLTGDSAVWITRSSLHADREANSALLLGSLIAQAEVGPGEGMRFLGDPRTAVFTTWCRVPAGWQERCRVALGFVRSRKERLLAVLPTGETVVVLADDFGSGTFTYLTSATDGGTWISTWGDRVGPPLAVGVVLDRDTLILPIGPRG